jgi:putative aldouronate transport system substrate-binding protein
MLLTCIAAFPASAAQAPVELTVLTMRWGDMGDTFTNNQWLKDTEAKLGVKINWQVVSSNDWAEKRGILLAGGQLPDIFIGNQTMTDADVTSNRDYFLELTDVVNQYMPNYKHALEAIPAMKKIVTEVDGKMYSFSKIQPARPTVRNQLIINKTSWTRLACLRLRTSTSSRPSW